MSITGKCLCGAISYSVENPPALTGVCHCKNCQRQAGSAFPLYRRAVKRTAYLR